MKAFLVTVGSQGDVRPMVALADRLLRDGHEVVLAAPRLFRPLATACGVPFAPLDVDMMRVADAVSGRSGLRHLVKLATAMRRLAGPALRDAWPAAAGSGADVVVHHPVLPVGQHLAEGLGVPAVVALPLPALVPTAAFPSPVWSRTTLLPRAANRASYRLAMLPTGPRCRAEIDCWRDTLGLPQRPGRHDPLRSPGGGGVPVLHAVSRHVLPPPADWPDRAHVTGYWSLRTPPDWAPPRKLAAFLDAGDPPVYVGFGSMPVADLERLVATVREVSARIGVRAIVASAYHSPGRTTSSEQVLVVRHVPHDWLFPRVRVVVHHGGAGTTGAAAAAGRPQVICPVGIDQPFWARRMRVLGVAAEAPALRHLTAPSLERALRRVLGDRDLRERADELGSRIRAEDGPGQAVALLERAVAGSPLVEAGLS